MKRESRNLEIDPDVLLAAVIECRCPAALAEIGAIASAGRERLDGSVYHRAASVSSISAPSRLVAAADAYDALREGRRHRSAMAYK